MMDGVFISSPVMAKNIEFLLFDPLNNPVFIGESREASHRDEIALV
jgi:hypothetical protein